jgi:hypothetical protein
LPRIATFCDAPLPAFVAAGGFARDEREIGHEVAGDVIVRGKAGATVKFCNRLLLGETVDDAPTWQILFLFRTQSCADACPRLGVSGYFPQERCFCAPMAKALPSFFVSDS